jgi:hypothetical protein
MTSQARDLNKLKKFIKSFGLRLYFRPYTRYTDLAHYVSGQNITVFVSKKINKTEIILSLLHEIGHHLDWITNKRLDKETEKAYTKFDDKDFKKYAKIILDVERAGIKHMTSIHKILNLEISIDKVKRQQKIDLFHYEFFYKNKKFPSIDDLIKFESKLKYGKKRKKYRTK